MIWISNALGARGNPEGIRREALNPAPRDDGPEKSPADAPPEKSRDRKERYEPAPRDLIAARLAAARRDAHEILVAGVGFEPTTSWV